MMHPNSTVHQPFVPASFSPLGMWPFTLLPRLLCRRGTLSIPCACGHLGRDDKALAQLLLQGIFSCRRQGLSSSASDDSATVSKRARSVKEEATPQEFMAPRTRGGSNVAAHHQVRQGSQRQPLRVWGRASSSAMDTGQGENLEGGEGDHIRAQEGYQFPQWGAHRVETPTQVASAAISMPTAHLTSPAGLPSLPRQVLHHTATPPPSNPA